MALDQSALLELLDALKATDADDVVRRSLEAMLQALVDAEATARIGAEPHQRTETRTTQRNGYRDRLVTTAAGDVELRIPKLAMCGVKYWAWTCGIVGGLGARRGYRGWR